MPNPMDWSDPSLVATLQMETWQNYLPNISAVWPCNRRETVAEPLLLT